MLSLCQCLVLYETRLCACEAESPQCRSVQLMGSFMTAVDVYFWEQVNLDASEWSSQLDVLFFL